MESRHGHEADFISPTQHALKAYVFRSIIEQTFQTRVGTELAGRFEKFSIISAFEGASGSGILSNGVTGSIEKSDWRSVSVDGPF